MLMTSYRPAGGGHWAQAVARPATDDARADTREWNIAECMHAQHTFSMEDMLARAAGGLVSAWEVVPVGGGRVTEMRRLMTWIRRNSPMRSKRSEPMS